MHPSTSAALETPHSERTEAQTWLCSSDLSHPLHHSSSNLCRTPTPTQLRESNNPSWNSWYHPSHHSRPGKVSMESTGFQAAPSWELNKEPQADPTENWWQTQGWHWTPLQKVSCCSYSSGTDRQRDLGVCSSLFSNFQKCLGILSVEITIFPISALMPSCKQACPG